MRRLRYGSVMIMTDQDHDGSHIKGLIINFVHHFWPSLFRHPGFLKEFVTPIIRAAKDVRSKGAARQQPDDSVFFYTLQEFNEWFDNLTDA